MIMSLEQELCRSVLSGNLGNIHRLVGEGASVNTNHASQTACTRAIILGIPSVIDVILNTEKCDVNAGNGDERTPLFIAVEYGRVNVVKQLLSLGADINKPDYRKTTPLIMAVRQGHTSIAKYLIENGADLTYQTFNGETALYVACSAVNVEMVKCLLHHNVSVNVQTNDRHSRHGSTPLMIALPSPYELKVKNRKKSDMLKIVRMLLDAGSDVNMVDERGNTALHLATDFLDVHTVCVLAGYGADLQMKNIYNETAFDIALKKKIEGFSIAICLLLYGFRIDGADYACSVLKQILSACVANQSNKTFSENHQRYQRNLLFELLMKDIPNSIDLLESCTPLGDPTFQLVQELKSVYAESGPESLSEQCRRAIRRNMNTQRLKGITSLPVATCMKVFLSLEYDYVRSDPMSLCDLLLAITEDDAKAAKTLIKSDMNLDVSVMNYTPLTLAASLGNIDMVELLLHNGADPTVFDNRGNSALHEGAAVGNVDVIDALLHKNCDVNALNTDGETPVMKSAMCGKFVALRFLVDKGGECLECNKGGRYPIHYAAASGHLSACKILLEKGVSPNQRDHHGNTPLHLAASCGLVYTGDNIDLPALFPSETAMHLDGIRNALGGNPSKHYFVDNSHSCSFGVRHLEVVRLLLQSGADVNNVNDLGISPKSLALEFYNGDIVDVLNSS